MVNERHNQGVASDEARATHEPNPQAVSAVPVSVANASGLSFPLLNAEPDPADCLNLEWILVAVDRHGDGLIIDASPDFYKVDLITELFACDNGLTQPKGLAVGLYRVTNVRVWADDEDVDIKGDWFAIYTQGIEAGTGETAQPVRSEGRKPDPEGDAPQSPQGDDQ